MSNDENFPDSNKIIEALAPFVTEQRKARIESVIAGRLLSVQLAIEAPSDINNALAAVRTAEALGVSEVHIIRPQGEANAARAITQGAIYWVKVNYYSNWAEFMTVVAREGLQLAAGAVTATLPLSAVPVENPLCVLVGNERRGLSQEALCDAAIHYKVPMYGMTESFNLSVSAAISLYDITSRKRILLGQDSDLTLISQQQLRADYYMKSVAPRLVRALRLE